jgi:hypothetical protein
VRAALDTGGTSRLARRQTLHSRPEERPILDDVAENRDRESRDTLLEVIEKLAESVDAGMEAPDRLTMQQGAPGQYAVRVYDVQGSYEGWLIVLGASADD